jgi:hypothetical protein
MQFTTLKCSFKNELVVFGDEDDDEDFDSDSDLDDE